MSTETHEIIFKSNYADLKKAEAEYKIAVSNEIAADKLRVSEAMTTNKVIVEQAKLKNQLLLRDDADMRKKLMQSEKDFRNQASKFTGQSVELGSQTHIQGLRSQLRGMMPGTESYTKLDAQLKNLTASYNAARGSNSLFNRGLLETGENLVTITAGFYLAAQGVINFTKAVVSAYSEQEKSLTQLNAVTEGNVGLRDRLISKSSDIQNTFGIPDETIQSLQAFLVLQGRSEEQINKTIEAARLLSIVQGTDIKDALMKVDATYEGQIGKLGKLGDEFKKLSATELENGGAVDIIISKYSKIGDIQDTTYTKTQKLSAAWSETKETLGAVVVDAVNPLIVGLSNLGLKGQEVVRIVGLSVTGFGTLLSVLKHVENGIKSASGVVDNLLFQFEKMAQVVPGAGSYFTNLTSSVTGFKRQILEAIGLMDILSNKAGIDIAKGGTKFVGTSKELDANSGRIFTGTTGTGTRQQDQKEELNFLESLRKKVSELQSEIKTLGDLENTQNITEYEKLNILDEKIKKQKELNELMKRGGLGELPSPQNLNNLLLQDLGIRQAGIGRNPRDAQITLEEELSKLEAQRLDYAKSIGSEFVNILQITGLMKTEFGQVIAMIQSLIGGFSTGFDFVKSLAGFIGSFIPGGGLITNVIGGPSGGGSMRPMMAGGGGGNGNMTVIVNSEVEKTKSVKFYQNTLPEYNRRQTAKSL